MQYKLILLDVDGTLYSHTTKSIPESTIKALKMVQEKGIKIGIASGRSKIVTAFTGILDILDFDFFVTTNGNLVIDKFDNVIYSNPMNQKGIDMVLDLVDKYELNATFMTLDDFYIYRDIDERAHLGFDPLSIPLPYKKEYKRENIYQINLFCEDEFMPYFEETKEYLQYSRLAHYGYDIYTKDHSKATGIEKLCEYLKISKDECIAFGDGHNDAEMVKFVGLGIAMGNALEKVKVASDYVTSDIDDDGIYNALKHFNII